MAACFAAGVGTGWWLHASGGPQPAGDPAAIVLPAPQTLPAPSDPPTVQGGAAGSPSPPEGPPRPWDPASAGLNSPTPDATGAPAIGAAPRGGEPTGAIEELRLRDLRVPIDGAQVNAFKDAFNEHRAGDGGHTHEAVDLPAPRQTPVHAIEDGTIAKLFDSRAGGHTVYQFDPTQRFAYYYAHLDHYAEGLHDGQRVSAGDVIGYVGTTGNAPPDAPHLHFAIFELGPEKRWSQGTAIDPYLVYKK
ncbi:MAG: M23 family metallopeptidase [Acidobacteriota bacterium]